MRDVEGAVPYGNGVVAGTLRVPSPREMGWWWDDCGCFRDVEGAVPYEFGVCGLGRVFLPVGLGGVVMGRFLVVLGTSRVPSPTHLVCVV